MLTCRHAQLQRKRGILNLQAGLTDHLGRTTRTQQPKAELLERLGKGQEARLVVDRQQRDGGGRHFFWYGVFV